MGGLNDGLPPGFGGRLREERERLAYTQAEFAELLGISRRTVIDYESGQDPGFVELMSSLRSMGVDLLYLLLGVRHSEDHSVRVLKPQALRKAVQFAERFCVDEDGRPLSAEMKAEFVLHVYDRFAAGEGAREINATEVTQALEAIQQRRRRA